MPLSALLVASAVIGCASDMDSQDEQSNTTIQPLTCEVLVGPNCWKTAVAEALECAPATTASENGFWDYDTRECDYDNGTLVDLSGTSVAEERFTQDLQFEVSANGTHCASFEDDDDFGEDDDTMSLTTNSGTVTFRWGRSLASLSCPDGVTYEAHQLDVLNCEESVRNLPAHSLIFGASTARFGFFQAS